jgi:broad specificity phosphatase PhoE
MNYVSTPDWLIPLTSKGREQAANFGTRLKEIIKDEPVYFYTSPYLRTKQTLNTILDSALVLQAAVAMMAMMMGRLQRIKLLEFVRSRD